MTAPEIPRHAKHAEQASRHHGPGRQPLTCGGAQHVGQAGEEPERHDQADPDPHAESDVPHRHVDEHRQGHADEREGDEMKDGVSHHHLGHDLPNARRQVAAKEDLAQNVGRVQRLSAGGIHDQVPRRPRSVRRWRRWTTPSRTVECCSACMATPSSGWIRARISECPRCARRSATVMCRGSPTEALRPAPVAGAPGEQAARRYRSRCRGRRSSAPGARRRPPARPTAAGCPRDRAGSSRGRPVISSEHTAQPHASRSGRAG